MKTTESIENYLETILVLSQKNPAVRAIDIVDRLGFKKSSVSVAMKHLRELKYITVSKEGFISFTADGKKIAEMIFERHKIISSFLMNLGVDEKIAVEDACRIEHVISKESFEALKKHILRETPSL